MESRSMQENTGGWKTGTSDPPSEVSLEQTHPVRPVVLIVENERGDEILKRQWTEEREYKR
jgi:hypothetical protein